MSLRDRGHEVPGLDNLTTTTCRTPAIQDGQPIEVFNHGQHKREFTYNIGYKPNTPIEVGVRNFVDWFCEYYCAGRQASSVARRSAAPRRS